MAAPGAPLRGQSPADGAESGGERSPRPGRPGALLAPSGRRTRPVRPVPPRVPPPRGPARSLFRARSTGRPGRPDHLRPVERLLRRSRREEAVEPRWVATELGPDIPLHFTAFHPDYRLLEIPGTPPATLARAREIAVRNGVHHVYTGNVHDVRGQSTFCHACGALVIERDWYELGAYRVTAEGRCEACGAVVPGVFGERAGSVQAAAAADPDRPELTTRSPRCGRGPRDALSRAWSDGPRTTRRDGRCGDGRRSAAARGPVP